MHRRLISRDMRSLYERVAKKIGTARVALSIRIGRNWRNLLAYILIVVVFHGLSALGLLLRFLLLLHLFLLLLELLLLKFIELLLDIGRANTERRMRIILLH